MKESVKNMDEKRKIAGIYKRVFTNGRMVMRIMISVSQNEIEKCSERTKFGMVGAIKSGHIPNRSSLGFTRDNKKLVPDPFTLSTVVLK